MYLCDSVSVCYFCKFIGREGMKNVWGLRGSGRILKEGGMINVILFQWEWS